MRVIIILVGSALLLSCATSKNWVATGGDRAGGTIQLSYDVGPFEIPEVSEQQGRDLATKRCQAWGYSEAEEFGGELSSCVDAGCNTHRITKEYQCIGDLEK